MVCSAATIACVKTVATGRAFVGGLQHASCREGCGSVPCYVRAELSCGRGLLGHGVWHVQVMRVSGGGGVAPMQVLLLCPCLERAPAG
jgi:hypothetical protein